MEIILKYIIASIFTLAILGKVTGKTKPTFKKSGYSQWFMYSVALAEFFLTISLFTAYDIYATIGLIGILGGAIFTLFYQKSPPNKYIMALVTMFLLIVLFFQKLNF
ncbi:MAG: DoxX family protein [Bacteroidetes bacterium]|nr:DoxX family protein [Bacteroidota bacterium]